jgi:hypothetical protein
MDGYARKKYAHMPLGEFWIDIARQVITCAAKTDGQPNFSAAIQRSGCRRRVEVATASRSGGMARLVCLR